MSVCVGVFGFWVLFLDVIRISGTDTCCTFLAYRIVRGREDEEGMSVCLSVCLSLRGCTIVVYDVRVSESTLDVARAFAVGSISDRLLLRFSLGSHMIHDVSIKFDI